MTDQIDDLVRESLAAFADDLRSTGWSGRREHEAKSLYAFGYLAPRCRPGAFLHDPAQIALDTPVLQIDHEAQRRLSGGTGAPKRVVAKDLLIWPEPRLTCWRDGEPSGFPAVIMEWKLNAAGVHAYDVAWLRGFSAARPGFVGYALTVNPKRRGPLLACTRVHLGAAADGWLAV